MSDFIVPISGLPSIASITEKQQPKAITDGLPFEDILKGAIENMTVTGENSQDSMYELALGGSDDLHSGAIDMLKYNTSVSFTSAVVSNVVKAYNELMRMGI